MISRYSIILVVGFVAVAAAFSFSPQKLATKQCNIQSHSALSMQSNDNEYNTRRNFLTKVVATTITPILLSSTQASAAVGKCCAYLMLQYLCHILHASHSQYHTLQISQRTYKDRTNS